MSEPTVAASVASQKAVPSEVTMRDRYGRAVMTFQRHDDGRWFRWKVAHAHRPDQRKRQFWTLVEIEERALLLCCTLHPSGAALAPLGEPEFSVDGAYNAAPTQSSDRGEKP